MDKNSKDFLAVVGVRPMLMLTGFLGAGKTTFLRSILDELSSRKCLADVILNDRENAQIDQEALHESAASVEALTGSCVCCEGMDELYDIILKVSKSGHSILLIELNGAADPVPLMESFTLLESKFRLHPRWQVCVVDGRQFGHRGYHNGLESLQLETASHYYISHASDLPSTAKLELIEAIERINPRANSVTAAVIAEALHQAAQKNRRHSLTLSKGCDDMNVLLEPLKSPLPQLHLHERHQLAHEFTGCNIVIPEAVEAARVIKWLEGLPAAVIRAKALVNIVSDLDSRFLYERVGLEVSPKALPVRNIQKVPCSALFIGQDLQPDELLHFSRKVLHSDCHFPNS